MLLGKEHYLCQSIPCIIDGPSCLICLVHRQCVPSVFRWSWSAAPPRAYTHTYRSFGLLHDPCPPHIRIFPKLSHLHETGVISSMMGMVKCPTCGLIAIQCFADGKPSLSTNWP
jgi:hypothetical protein